VELCGEPGRNCVKNCEERDSVGNSWNGVGKYVGIVWRENLEELCVDLEQQ